MTFNCDVEIIHLSKALPKMKALNKLSLYWNQIGHNGIIHLIEALPKMKALNRLGLSDNKIGKKTKELIIKKAWEDNGKEGYRLEL